MQSKNEPTEPEIIIMAVTFLVVWSLNTSDWERGSERQNNIMHLEQENAPCSWAWSHPAKVKFPKVKLR